MITISGTSAHQQPVVGAQWLAELLFSTGTLRLTTGPLDVQASGYTWSGVGALGSISAVGESADGQADKITLSLSIVDSAMLAAALADPATYRGRTVRLYLQLTNEQFQPVGNPVMRWAGVMDRVTIRRDTASTESGAAGGAIEMQCMRRGFDRSRAYMGLRLTHAQQQARFPGDTGLRYVRKLIEQPSLWLSKRFQQQ